MNQAQATENREYVRTLLRERQPGFAAALESAISSSGTCARCGCLIQVREQCAVAGITASSPADLGPDGEQLARDERADYEPGELGRQIVASGWAYDEGDSDRC